MRVKPRSAQTAVGSVFASVPVPPALTTRHGCAFGFSCDSWFRAIGNQMKRLTGENDDAYQRLMDYWAETMQDDCYLIAADGWVKGAQPREIVQVKDKNNKLTWPEPHDYVKGKR